MARLNLHRPSKNQQGFTLLEAMVAAALLGTIVLVGAQYGSRFVPYAFSAKRACQAQAQSIINVIAEESYYRQVANFVPIDNNRTIPNNSFPTPSRGVTSTADWWSEPASAYLISDYDNLPAVPGKRKLGAELNNNQLIEGSMRTLAAIYNNNPQVQHQFGSYPLLTGVPGTPSTVVPLNSGLAPLNPVITMQLLAYNQMNNAAFPGFATLNPMPDHKNGIYGNAPGAPATLLPYPWDKADPVKPYPGPSQIGGPGGTQYFHRTVGDLIAIEMSVHISYNPDVNNLALVENCDVVQKFSYPPDRTAPNPPDYLAVVWNPTVDPGTNAPYNCVAQPASSAFTIEIGHTGPGGAPGGTLMEPGTQFLCRDLSWTRNWQPDTGGIPHSQAICIRGGAFDPIEKPWFPDDTLEVYSPNRDHWVPCDQLVQCGLAPSGPNYYAQANPNFALDNQRIAVNYTNVPYGCVANFEAVAVDAAGNVSALAYPNQRQFLDMTPGNGPLVPPPVMDEIHYATCGVFCPAPAVTPTITWPWPDVPAGYWTCRPEGICCVDPLLTTHCTPYN